MTNKLLMIPHGLSANIYVRELGRAYQKLGINVAYNADNLAESNLAPGILHLHWPEEQYRWSGSGSPETRAKFFLEKLAHLKSSGTRIVWTVHNMAPHEFRESSLDRHVYQSVIDLAELIVHHCEYSRQLLSQEYKVAPTKSQIVCPHGHFLAYPSGITKQAARSKLGIPHDAFVYLQFGQVRAYKGLSTMLNVFSRLRVPNKYLLVAGRYSAPQGRTRFFERARIAYLKRFRSNTLLCLQEVPDEDVQIYMAAGDVLVLTHTAGLNSGVAVLGMSFGKPVIAPDIGCIGAVLGQGSNFLYQPGSISELTAAMKGSASADLAHIGTINRTASARWTWDDMARSILYALGSPVTVQEK